ncbi:MAG: hypothetical protein RR945_06385 [Erysipelotrichaceae bacterium]
MINTIYFTNTEIVITEGTYSKKVPKIKKRVVVEMPEGAVKDGEILDLISLTHAINGEIKKNKMKGTGVIFSTQLVDIDAIPISVPYVKGRLDQAVNMKLSESYLGITENNYIDYKINKIENNLCSGVAIIAPKTLLNTYYKLAVNMGIKLLKIDYIGNVLHKNLLLEDHELNKKTYLIADTSGSSIQVHLISNNLLAMSRNEFGSMVALGTEEKIDEYVFDPRLTIIDEDQEKVLLAYTTIKEGIEDLKTFNMAQTTLFKRFSEGSEISPELLNNLESSLKSIHDMLIDYSTYCKSDIDFDGEIEKVLMRFNSMQEQSDWIENLFKKTQKMNSSFFKSIEEVMELIKTNISETILILDKYIVTKIDKSKEERNSLINRTCRQVANLISIADLSGDFPDIEKLYVYGIELDATEKKLVEKNIPSLSVIGVANYRDFTRDDDGISYGILYNEYRYLKDIDLSKQIEKNDKASRNNIDNIVFGLGGVMIFGIFAFMALSGFYKFQTYQMNQTIEDNNRYMEKNKEITRIVQTEQELNSALEESKNFEDYFNTINFDLNKERTNVEKYANGVSLIELGIDTNFLATGKVFAPSLAPISLFLETLSKNGYSEVVLNDTAVKDNGYEVGFTYRYQVETKEKK